jgi:hypothetical protein
MPRNRVTRESVPNTKPVADNADGFFVCALKIVPGASFPC